MLMVNRIGRSMLMFLLPAKIKFRKSYKSVQSFSRTPFLTEHISKKLTFSKFILQSEEKKKFNRAFD